MAIQLFHPPFECLNLFASREVSSVRLPVEIHKHRPAGCREMAALESNEGVNAQFIEMLGKTLFRMLTEGEPGPSELAEVGVDEQSIVRVNRQGDIELRRKDRWDLIGGLLGDFESRVREETGLDWA